MNEGLKDKYRQLLIDILSQCEHVEKVVLFGSRAMGTFTTTSDVDIVLFGDDLTLTDQARLAEQIENTTIPQTVDLVLYRTIESKELLEHIKKNGVQWWPEKEKTNCWAMENKESVNGEGGSVKLPEGWEEKMLGDVIITNDVTHSKKDKWKFINYLDTGNLTKNQISEVQHLVVGEDKIPSRAKRKVQPGDIVYSTVRPNQNHYGILKNPVENLLVSTGFVTIRAKKDEADTNFIYWFLVQPTIIERLQTIGEHSTSAYPSIKPLDIEGLKINLPPPTEQKAIAHILGSLDDRIELNRRMNETLEAMAQALFKSWFVDFDPVLDNAVLAGNPIPDELEERAEIRRAILARNQKGEVQRVKGENEPESSHFKLHHSHFPSEFIQTDEMGWIPKGWECKTAEGVASISIGKTPPRKESKWFSDQLEDNYRWISIKDMGVSGPYLGFTFEYLTKDAVDKHRVKKVPRDTVVLSFKLTVGRVAITQHECTTNEAIAHFVGPRYGLSPEYLYAYLKAFDFSRLGSTSSIATAINSKIIKSMPVLLPERVIIERYNDSVADLFKKISLQTSQVEALIKLRDTLLPKLISGEIHIPEAEKLVEENRNHER